MAPHKHEPTNIYNPSQVGRTGETSVLFCLFLFFFPVDMLKSKIQVHGKKNPALVVIVYLWHNCLKA